MQKEEERLKWQKVGMRAEELTIVATRGRICPREVSTSYGTQPENSANLLIVIAYEKSFVYISYLYLLGDGNYYHSVYLLPRELNNQL